MAEKFLETGEPQVPRASHLFAYFETAERTPLRVTSLNGTNRTNRAGLMMSVNRGRSETTGGWSNRRKRPRTDIPLAAIKVMNLGDGYQPRRPNEPVLQRWNDPGSTFMRGSFPALARY
jgi:hypothetical protein